MATTPTTYRIAAGWPGEIYWQFAEVLREAGRNVAEGVELELVQTAGSAESVRLIAEQKVDFAILQSNARGYFTDTSRHVRGVTALYTEAIHLFGFRSEHVESSDDLHGLRIATGEKGSGTYEDSHRILSTLGIYRNEYIALDTPMGEIATLGPDRRPDAIFLIDGFPNSTIAAIGGQGKLVSLRSHELDALLKRYEYLVPVTIPANTYSNQPVAVKTVGMRALLVADADVPRATITALLQRLNENTNYLALSTRYGEDRNPHQLASQGMTFPLHDGARDFFRNRVILSRIVHEWLPDILVFSVLVLGWVYLLTGRSRAVRHIRRSMYLKSACIFATVYILATLVIHLAEQNRTPGFDSITRSFWSTAVYVLSGLENREPRTPIGRAGLAVLLFAGVGMLGSITGKFASMFILYREKKMPKDLEDHIIICNWNNRAESLIRELHSSEAIPDVDIVVITDKKDGDIPRLIREDDTKGSPFKHVCCCTGSPLNSEVVTSARPHAARAIVILANDGVADPDAQSALIALVVRSQVTAAKPADGKQPHLIAECVDPRKRQLLKSAGIDEIICSSQYGLGVLAQCCLHRNISQVYDRILHFTEDSSELYVAGGDQLPRNTTGRTYHEICVAILQQHDPQKPVTPIGIQRKNGECLINPKGENNKFTMEEGDALIVIAFTTPDLSGIDCTTG